MSDERSGDAAFVHPTLEQPKWCIGDIRPSASIAFEGVVRSKTGGIAAFPVDFFVTPAVVGKEQDEGIIEYAVTLETFNNSAYSAVHRANLRRIDCHSQIKYVLLLPGKRVPCRHAIVSG